MKVKKNDTVLVITGKDAGKTAKVLAAMPKTNKVVVEGINMQKKSKKARSAQEVSQIVEQAGPINASNVLVVCPVCGKATRVAHSVIEGKKVRSCKKCNGSLDKEYVKATKKETKKTVKAEDLKGAKLKKSTTTKKEEK